MTFEESLNQRYACKLFKKDEKISDEKLKRILEAGRMSPSSHGFEPWKFVVLSQKKHNEELSQFCHNQENVATASHNIIILARTDLQSKDEFIHKQIKRISGRNEENYQRVLSAYTHKTDTMNEKELYHYSQLQCYIALMQMANAAIFQDIQSCMIGGFEKEKVDTFLKLKKPFQTAVILALGYKAVEPKYPKQRLAFDEVVEFYKG